MRRWLPLLTSALMACGGLTPPTPTPWTSSSQPSAGGNTGALLAASGPTGTPARAPVIAFVTASPFVPTATVAHTSAMTAAAPTADATMPATATNDSGRLDDAVEPVRVAPTMEASPTTRRAARARFTPALPPATSSTAPTAGWTAVEATPTRTPAPPPATRTPTPTRPTATTTAAPGPTATVAPAASVQIVTPPGSVERGRNAVVAARTSPGLRCEIAVTYPSGVSRAAGLKAKTADAAGAVSWTWRLGGNTTPGTYPVVISCGGGQATTQLTVTR